MFDGNYRSRRPVNLNNKKKRLTALEVSRLKRQERELVARKTAAATHIQRLWRGYAARQALICSWQEFVDTELQKQQAAAVPSKTTSDGHDSVTAVLNMLWRWKQAPHDEIAMLKRYAGSIEQQQQQSSTAPAVQRIVEATLRNYPQLSQCREKILAYSLNLKEEESKNTSANNPSTTPTIWQRLGGSRGFVQLVQAYTVAEKNAAAFLYKILQSSAPDSVQGRGVLAALALANNNNSSDSDNNAALSVLLEAYNNHAQEMTTNDDSFSFSLGSMVQNLVSQHAHAMLFNVISSNKSSSSRADVAAAVQFLKIVLLENNNAHLVWALNRVVCDPASTTATNQEVTIRQNKEDEDDDSEEDDDDEDTMRAHSTTVELKTSSAKSSSYHRLTKYDLQTVPKLNRLFASHVQKANQWYVASTNSSTTQSQETALAVMLGDPALWLHWGQVLLDDDEEGNDNIDEAAIRDFVTVLAVLLQATTGLQPRQNAQSSQLLSKLAFSGRFLERLWRFIVSQIDQKHESKKTAAVSWRSGNSTVSQSDDAFYYAFSVFSDLFAHNLIALRDDTFLAKHTHEGCAILAEDVIQRLQSLLYDMYWSKPVRSSDFKLVLGEKPDKNDTLLCSSAAVAATTEERSAAARARLMLTGTKLWNSLYERWCRLVRRNPFCDEASWLFPAMTTLSPDKSVVQEGRGGSSHPRGGGEHMDDAMDVDDDDDSSMDSDMEDANGAMRDEAEAESDALAEAFSDPKMARILTCIPQALPFSRRVKLFDSLLKADKIKSQDEEGENRQLLMAMMRGEEADVSIRPRVEIHRDRLYEDSMHQLNHLGPKLKRRIQVTFINQHGAQEAGIDGGGVFKEFLDDLIKDAFSIENSTSDHQLFSVTPLETLRVNSDLVPDRSLLSHYEFLGRVMGKAVYESILVEPQFCLPFLNQLLGKSNSPEDLKNIDPEYYRNLAKLLNLSTTELQGMGLTFELTLGSGLTSRTVELMPGGRNIPVTKENVIQYIHLISHLRLNVFTAQQTRAFLRGFRELIPSSWVRLFSAYELQKLISGDDSVKGIDVASLKQHMQYSGGYHPDQPVVKYFWEILEEMTADQQHKILKFMTSCSRQPLLGFGSLEPAPCLQQIRLPDQLFAFGDQERIFKEAPLPTSSTCMNLLKLPNYRSKELMRVKLFAAIESGAGFELT